MKQIVLAVTAFVLIINCSCLEKGTGPVIKKGLDTTSHNINWQTFEIGVYPSILHDVAIINSAEIWAVGEIHTEETDKFDSLGNWVNPYNAVLWDGEKWDLKHIKTPFRNGNIIPNLEGIFAYNENDIWLCSGTPKYWNGNKWTNYDLWEMGVLDNNDGGVLNIWGISSKDIYFAGRKGTIVHYNGQTWKKIESGTNIKLTDVWGSPDGSVVWVSGFDQVDGSILLRNRGSGFEKIAEINSPDIPELHNIISLVFRSIWTDNPDTVYVGSVGRVYNTPVDYSTYALENKWFDYNTEPGFPNETRVIRGTSRNDLFVAGFQNEIRHYNGKSWHKYGELLTESGYWFAMDVKDNVIAAVGETSNSIAVVTLGIRTTK